MTDFDVSEEPTNLPAAGHGDRSDSHGAVGVIEKRPEAPPPRPGPGARARSQPAAASADATAAAADGLLRRSATALLLHLDVVLVVLALPVALSLGASSFGYAIGAGAWVLQRVLAHTDRRWIRRATTPRTQLGLNLFEAFGRIWLLAGAIVLAGVAGGRADGLTAALVIFAAYSVEFAIRVLSGRRSSRPGGGPAR